MIVMEAIGLGLVVSLVLCTLNWFFRRRRHMRGMGEVLVHLGFLLIFSGFVLGSGFGERTQGIQIAEGETAAVGESGLSLRVDGVDSVRGPGGRVWDVVSRVALLRDGRAVAEGMVRTNHPLIWGSTVVYPQGAYAKVLGASLATSEGSVTLRQGEAAELAGGRRLVLKGTLDPGDRRGPYFGPGVLLSHVGGAGESLGTAFLAPAQGGVTDLGGLRVRLLDLAIVPNGVYNVHRDPGVNLVLWGAVILTVGTFWALFGYLWRRPVAS